MDLHNKTWVALPSDPTKLIHGRSRVCAAAHRFRSAVPVTGDLTFQVAAFAHQTFVRQIDYLIQQNYWECRTVLRCDQRLRSWYMPMIREGSGAPSLHQTSAREQ